MKDSKWMTSHFYVYILHLHLIKMVGNKDKKEKSIKKGKANRKGGIVNQSVENSEHLTLKKYKSGTRRRARRRRKRPMIQYRHSQKRLMQRGDHQLPSTKRRKVTVNLDEEQEEGLVDWFKVNEIFSIINLKGNSRIRTRRRE